MFVRTGIIFVVCMSLMGLILGPKVYFHYKEKTENRSASTVHVSGIGDASTSKYCKNADYGMNATHVKASIKLLKHEVTELRALLEVRTSEVNEYKRQSMMLPPPSFMDQSSDQFKNQSLPFSPSPSSMDKSSGIESSDCMRPIDSGSGRSTSTASSGLKTSDDTMTVPMMSEEELALEIGENEDM